MAEQTFRSPGFFEREIDASTRKTEITGVPAGIIGTAEKGPAFVPVTVGSFQDFVNRFGTIDPDRFGPYAVQAFLKNRTAATYMRVLGAGANETTSQITNTQNYGTVVNAGLVLSGNVSASTSNANNGVVQFLCARHDAAASEAVAMPEFTDNPSFNNADAMKIVRGVIFNATTARTQVIDLDETWTSTVDDECQIDSGGLFAVVISSSLGTTFANQEDNNGTVVPGVKIVSASLDPASPAYISNVLNTDPTKFVQEQHLLYLDFAVEDEIAPVATSAAGVALLSGSANFGKTLQSGAGNEFTMLFGRYDTRYTTPTSPQIISQPFGGTEYPLFRFESLSDGAYGNDKVKISIANLRASTNKNYRYGTFEVQVRRFDDTDLAPQILESYPECNLDPNSESFIGRKVGDYKTWYNFDAENDDERRIIVSGKYPNQSVYIRTVINEAVYRSEVPTDSLPFGFSGIPALKTSDSLTDNSLSRLEFGGVPYGNTGNTRLWGDCSADGLVMTGSIIPPLPMRFKVTRGAVSTTAFMSGWPGDDERVDGRFYWGVKFERCPKEDDVTNAILNQNISSAPNSTVAAYTKFQGISKLDALVSGSAVDAFNANKFTLAKVALAGTGSDTPPATLLSEVTASAKEHMLEAAYIRNGVPDSQTYVVEDPDGYGKRITFATLAQSSSIKFNRFTAYLKFTTPMYGGWDGLNILDKDMSLMNDRATSTDASGETGKASSEFSATTIGLASNPAGDGRLNNNIFAYREAARIMTDPMTVRNNILSIPGIRDSYVTDWAADRTKAYSMAIYLMDIPSWSENAGRLFGDENRTLIKSSSDSFPDVRETAEQFESRAIDNNYCATYFPDVYITDSNNQQAVLVPSSVAALAALGYNDAVAYPWFAPAGFNRGSLGMVTNTDARLTASDRDDLYDVRINPIANFPNGGFVIFGQKTMQLSQSALDRVNVRRMMLELKRQVVAVANKILFEPNNAATRGRFINLVTPLLAAIQAQQGIESFKVVMDDTNNSAQDVESNKLNGRIVVVPTRAIEFIAIDFIITNSGVDFA